MERSIVQELKPQPESFTDQTLGMNSLIYQNYRANSSSEKNPLHQQPVLSPNAMILQKSRVGKAHYKELPSSFILVFQAIEIIRLSHEVESMSSALKDFQRNNSHQTNYEIQIKQLVDKCNQKDQLNFDYREELQRHKQASDKIYHELADIKNRYDQVDFSLVEKYKLEKSRNLELLLEIQKWKARHQSVESHRSEELDALKHKLEEQKFSQISTTSKHFQQKLDMERDDLNAKLREKREIFEEKELENRKLKNIYEQCQITMKEDQNKIELYEEKVALLSQETYRLNEVLKGKIEELNHLKMANSHEISMHVNDISYRDDERQVLLQKLKAFEQQHFEIASHSKQLEEQKILLKQRLIQFDKTHHQLTQAQVELENKTRTIEKKNKKIFDLEDTLQQSQTIKAKINTLIQQNDQLQTKVAQLQTTTQAKIQQLRQFKRTIADKLHIFDSWQIKYSKTTQKLFQQTSLLEKKWIKFSNIPQKDIEKEEFLQNQIKKWKQSNLQLQKHVFSLEGELTNLKNQMEKRGYEETILRKRCQELQVQLGDKEQKQVELESKHHHMSTTLQTKTKEIIKLNEEAGNSSKMLHQLTSKSRFIQENMANLEGQLFKVEKMLMGLKSHLEIKSKMMTANQRKRKEIEDKYELVFAWFLSKMQVSQQQPPFSSKNKTHLSGLGTFVTSQILLPEDAPSEEQENYALGNSIYSYDHQLSHQNKNKKENNVSIKQNDPFLQKMGLPHLMAHVLLCIEVESLRKRVGDKNAKLESMKNSIVESKSSPKDLKFKRIEGKGESLEKKAIYY